MYKNASYMDLLTLVPLDLSATNMYPVFVLGTLTYLIIVFCNLLVVATIALSKKLHKPMFILLFNLPISDMVGATAFFPHLLFSIVTQNRVISHSACITQAFLIHFYGTGNLLILSAMAYDRYIAICCPLRYNAIMSPKNLIRLIILIWFINFSMIVTLILLLGRFKICRTNIVDLYCNNPSLLKLVCEDPRINNYYGIISIVLLQGGPLSIIIYTYAQILRTCVMTNQTDARTKAFQTCGTHLVVFLILQINTAFTLIAHRIPNASPYIRRVLGVSILLFPPLLDPIIYGLKTRELKQGIVMFLKRHIFSTKL
ncbi:putative gustatory receptor clone PTE03 [Anoplopoma fimbria]|uniref:putative gustatory receptor clone PTE03 n=1 Tax=Anoplopoma fimbria TaxID=229290 RepID=UPI0023EE1B66|nr:putative gustatory receptor clone PTE03 [Anoplopoma fimbria]XP_054462353.1 putative gustatory receptor clone PTE03 [Anoplopoma fimbria]